jgi:hypothetical protein
LETLEEFIAERKPDTRMKVYNASTVGGTDCGTWTPSG